jgi:transcription antitermination factor NusA-like protein
VLAPADAISVRVRALTGGALELRCVERVPRTRTRVRVVAAEGAADAVEECLHELGWIAEGEWNDWH